MSVLRKCDAFTENQQKLSLNIYIISAKLSFNYSTSQQPDVVYKQIITLSHMANFSFASLHMYRGTLLA